MELQSLANVTKEAHVRTLHLIFVAAAAAALAGCDSVKKNGLTGPSEIAPASTPGAVESHMLAAPESSEIAASDPTTIEVTNLGTSAVTDWRRADVVFPRGTKSVRFHFDDLYTYSTNRNVYLSLAVLGRTLGWGTYVYPDSATRTTGRNNSVFYFGSGGVPSGAALSDGSIWQFRIRCDKVKTRDFFDFYGLDGVMRIESPRDGYYRGSRTVTFKVALNQSQTITFAVAGK